jgi:hypothetical protein
MNVTLGNYTFKVEVDKLRLNPEVREEEFSLN